jgi:hypothetical protein
MIRVIPLSERQGTRRARRWGCEVATLHGPFRFPSWPPLRLIRATFTPPVSNNSHRAPNTPVKHPSSRIEDRNSSVTSPTESAYPTYDGCERHSLRGPIALPFPHAPEQPVCRLQFPRICQEKDKRRFQGGQCRERRAQSTGADAEGPEGAAGVEGGYSLSGRRTCVVRGKRSLHRAGYDLCEYVNALLMLFDPTETNSRFTILPARPISRRGWQDRKADRKPWWHC